jgi:hypothetical protein
MAQDEDWQSLVTWDDEPLDSGALACREETGEKESSVVKEPAAAEGFHPQYVPSAPASLFSAPSSSFASSQVGWDLSAPPSLASPSFLGQGFASFGNSLSFSTTAASPATGAEDPLEDDPLPFSDPFASPERKLPGNLHQPGTLPAPSEQLFNPYLAGTSHAFGSLDVTASRALAELEGAGRLEEQYPLLDTAPPQESGAIPIPNSLPVRLRQNRPPPTLSVSPDTRRRSRTTAAAAAATSLNSPRTIAKRPAAASSPAARQLTFVNYESSPAGGGKMSVSSTSDQPRLPRGRVTALTPDQRSHAAQMRRIGACSNCKKRKEKCDPGRPCKACERHFKDGPIDPPCR